MRGSSPRSQTRAAVAFVAVLASIGAAFGACTSYQRANGEGCLKDVDCLSGYCIAQRCGLPPPPLAGSSYDDGGTTTSAPEASTPARDSSVSDSGTDGPAVPVDAGQDAAGPHDSGDGATTVGSLDANGSDASDAQEMDASDSSDGARDLDANPDAGDAQDAFNRLSPHRNVFA